MTNSLDSKTIKDLLDFANGKKIQEQDLVNIIKQGLVKEIPALTIYGCEIASENGWNWE